MNMGALDVHAVDSLGNHLWYYFGSCTSFWCKMFQLQPRLEVLWKDLRTVADFAELHSFFCSHEADYIWQNLATVQAAAHAGWPVVLLDGRCPCDGAGFWQLSLLDVLDSLQHLVSTNRGRCCWSSTKALHAWKMTNT
jgi:hypothetical protein